MTETSQFQNWRFCPNCGKSIRNLKVQFIGTCPKVICHSPTIECKGKWYGQSNSIGDRSHDAKTGNLAVASGCYVNGIGYSVSFYEQL